MSQQPYDRWYSLNRWRKRAKAHLRREPLCAMCLRQGKVTPATIADHIEPHKGDEMVFWFGPLQSLCKHHNGSKQMLEHRGYDTAIGSDGWPIDPKHPVNR